MISLISLGGCGVAVALRRICCLGAVAETGRGQIGSSASSGSEVASVHAVPSVIQEPPEETDTESSSAALATLWLRGRNPREIRPGRLSVSVLLDQVESESSLCCGG